MSPRRICLALAVGAVALGVALAIERRWLCDDAFISFRYADNLAHGRGLVFNAGERVEGDTNFLWTLWLSFGRVLGCALEGWSIFWGLACYAGALALLAIRGCTRDRALPIAVILAALHVSWSEFATSGLETSAFTLLALAGYVLACPAQGSAGVRRLALAGAMLALAALTRPDGVIFAAVTGAWLLAGPDRWRAALAFGAGFLAIYGPPTIWRIAYYGDFFPNTYYAKSAALAWWSQGLTYGHYYATRYWPLLLALPCVAVPRQRRAALLELALALSYALYVMRVGGDFMFGRLLVPITPFLVLLLQRGVDALPPRASVLAGCALVLGLVVTPSPVGSSLVATDGIDDERRYYTQGSWAEDTDRLGDELARLTDGLPIVVGFWGTQARTIYRSEVPTAIECAAGLTDATIAHQELTRRGRVGHEKSATLPYLRARGVDLLLSPYPDEIDRALGPAPWLELRGGTRVRVITLHPAIVDAMVARGAVLHLPPP